MRHRTKATGALLLFGGAWTPHDLRRTGATMMGELYVMGEVIERCLNHVERNKLKRMYQRHELKAEQREAWRLLGERIALPLSAGEHENLVAPVMRAGWCWPGRTPGSPPDKQGAWCITWRNVTCPLKAPFMPWSCPVERA